MAATLKGLLTKEQKATIERKAWELRADGWTQERIAAELDVNQATISRMLAAVEKRLHKEFAANAEQVKARQTVQLERIAEKALAQFDRSCEDAEKRKTVSKRVSSKPASEGEDRASDFFADTPQDLDNSGFVIEETQEFTGQSGNPALLAQARGALADIRTIWGMDSPKRQELTGRDGAPIPMSVEAAIATVYGSTGDVPGGDDPAEESEGDPG